MKEVTGDSQSEQSTTHSYQLWTLLFINKTSNDKIKIDCNCNKEHMHF